MVYRFARSYDKWLADTTATRVDILIICAFDLVMVVIGTYLFSKRQ
jgi:hypothetical protein